MTTESIKFSILPMLEKKFVGNFVTFFLNPKTNFVTAFPSNGDIYKELIVIAVERAECDNGYEFDDRVCWVEYRLKFKDTDFFLPIHSFNIL